MTDVERAKAVAVVMLGDLRSGLAFLTIVPASWLGERAQAADFRRAAGWFPLVGALVGLAGGVVAILAVACGIPAALAAILAVLATVLLTGALHEDGLADTADGFGGGATAERKLEIMDDSRVGTFGAVALAFSLAIRIAALAALLAAGGLATLSALVAAEAASRAAMVRLWYRLPAARLGGMSEATGPPDERAMVVALVVAAGIVAVLIVPTLGFWAACAGALSMAIVAAGFTRLVVAQIGGRTGDTLGACQQLSAVAFLVGLLPFA